MIYYALVRPERVRMRSLKVECLRCVPHTSPAQGEDSEGTWNIKDVCVRGPGRNTQKFFSESLILAQNERWQRGLGMQVERDPGDSNISW